MVGRKEWSFLMYYGRYCKIDKNIYNLFAYVLRKNHNAIPIF